MKKNALLFVIAILLSVAGLKAQTQMPNGDMETWTTNYRPGNWWTIDTMGLRSCFKTTDVHGGTYAARLTSLDTTIFTMPVKLPGMATLGKVNMSSFILYGGIPFPAKPDSLFFYYKCFPVNHDSATVYIYFWQYAGGVKDTVGMSFAIQTDTVPGFTPLHLPINWDGAMTGNPDSMNIVFMSSGGYNVQNKSTLYIDDISFYYTTTGIDQKLNEALNGVFPNPCHQVLNIPDVLNCDISVYSLTGAKIIQHFSTEQNYKLNTTSMSEGVYILEVKNDNRTKRTKIIVD